MPQAVVGHSANFVTASAIMNHWLNFEGLKNAVLSFWFLPAILGFFGLCLAAVSIWFDRTFPDFPPFLSSMGAVTTRSVLETIATASITVISLTYSITLVVFTLAAGNIGPRLLARFRESLMTRLSIGVFCATFLYSITVLVFVGDDHAPKFSAIVAFILSIISVYVLIVYVSHVSSQVMVDNEVAAATERATAAVTNLMRQEAAPQGMRMNRNENAAIPGWMVEAKSSGYVRRVSPGPLVKAAKTGDCVIFVKAGPGDFVVQGLPLAVVKGQKQDAIRDAIYEEIALGPSRSPDDDTGFLVHLIVEIALRALSPGMNDSYTAVSCVDNLSAIMSHVLKSDAPSEYHCDDDGELRVHFNAIAVADMLEKTLKPLRISARGNLIVTLRLLQGLESMARLAQPKYSSLIRHHADLIMQDAKDAVSNASDLKDVANLHKAVVEVLDGKQSVRKVVTS